MNDWSAAALRDVAAVLHPITNLAAHRGSGPLVLDRGKGVYVWDRDGKRYIEGLAGLWCLALGHGNEELIEAAREQMSRLSFAHLFGGRSHEPAIALAEKIKQISPAPTSKVFFTGSGSESNDTQVKILWYYNNLRGKPRKKRIISRRNGYHGTTVATASLTGLASFHAEFDLPMSRVLHVSCPHHWRGAEQGESDQAFASRLAAELEALIEREDPDTIAAFIAEPVMGAGGVIVPPATYFEKVEAVLDRYDISFIADEVITGFGRTGSMFGCETFGIRPSTVSLAKALSSAYVPIGAVTVPEPVYDALCGSSHRLGSFGHGHTYSGHPLGCAVALKALEIYERIDLVGHVRAITPVFQTRFKALEDHPLVGEARGVGLIGAVELVRDKITKTSFDPKVGVGAKAVALAQDEGLIARAVAGDTIAICPPLVINGAEINELFDYLTRALDRLLDWARRERHFN